MNIGIFSFLIKECLALGRPVPRPVHITLGRGRVETLAFMKVLDVNLISKHKSASPEFLGTAGYVENF
jgi:hypothetical protein